MNMNRGAFTHVTAVRAQPPAAAAVLSTVSAMTPTWRGEACYFFAKAIRSLTSCMSCPCNTDNIKATGQASGKPALAVNALQPGKETSWLLVNRAEPPSRTPQRFALTVPGGPQADEMRRRWPIHGLSANTAGALAYLAGIITGITSW